LSSTIYIIDPKRHAIELPRTLADFGAILERWGGEDDEVNPAFVALGKRLESRFPPPETAGDDSVWLASPAAEAATLGSAVWNLELPREDTIAVERFIAASAGELGLIAYDDQIGIGFLPGGAIVPEDRRALWSESLAAIDSGAVLGGASDVRKLVLATLDTILAPEGFKLLPRKSRHDPTFARTLGPLRQYLSMRIIHDDTCEFTFIVRHDALKAFWEGMYPGSTYEPAAMVVSLDFFHPGPARIGSWVVTSRASVRELVQLMRGKLLPLANLCRDLHGLDQLLNDESADTIRSIKGRLRAPHRRHGTDGSKGLRDDTRYWPRLAIARLAGNPREAEVAAQVDGYYANPEHHRQPEYALVKEALKTLAPLAKWRDAAQHRAALRPIPASLLAREAHPLAARMHHYEVSSQVRVEAEADPVSFWKRYAAPGGDELLVERWNAHGATLPAADRLPAEGVGREVVAPPAVGSPAVEVLLVRFPPSAHVEEMSYLAVGRTGSTYLVYTFENYPWFYNGVIPTLFNRTIGQGRSTRESRERPSVEQFVEYVRGEVVKAAAGAP
jgi:hypothetical protein